MAVALEVLFHQPMNLTDDIRRAIEETDSFEQECQDLGRQIETLGQSLRAIVRLVRHGNGCFCERPTSRIMEEVSRTLEKCFALIRKCKKGGILRRVIAITSATDFRRMSSSLDNALANVAWLLDVATDDDTGMPGMPPIASGVASTAMVWAMIAKIQGGNPSVREGAASYLASLASDSEQHGQLIVSEGGIPELLKLLNDGTLDGQLLAATALGELAVHQHRVQQIAGEGVIPVFVQTLTEGSMQVQAKVAWALSQMVYHDPDTQREFGFANVIKPLVALMLETMDGMFDPPPRPKTSIESIVKSSLDAYKSQINLNEVVKSGTMVDDRPSGDGTPLTSAGGIQREESQKIQRTVSPGVTEKSKPNYQSKHSGSAKRSPYYGLMTRDMSRREREKLPLEVKRDLRAQVTRALSMLARNNAKNCRMITDTKAMLGFAKLIEMEEGEVQRNSILAVMELTAVAETDSDLRRFAFKPTSPAAKAVVEQLLRIIKDPWGDPDLQVASVKAVGCLARTFPSREKKVIKSLVMKLGNTDDTYRAVAAEAIYALLKFVDGGNFLHLEHSQTIVEVSALPLLVQLAVLDEDRSIQFPALILLSQLALNAGRTNEQAFQEAAALSVLKYAASQNVQLSIEDLVFMAIQHLDLCQGGGEFQPHSFDW